MGTAEAAFCSGLVMASIKNTANNGSLRERTGLRSVWRQITSNPDIYLSFVENEADQPIQEDQRKSIDQGCILSIACRYRLADLMIEPAQRREISGLAAGGIGYPYQAQQPWDDAAQHEDEQG